MTHMTYESLNKPKKRIFYQKMATFPVLLAFLLLSHFGYGQVTYHLGNSLTDTNNDQLHNITTSAGKSHTYLRTTIPGAPTDWIWDHPGEALGEPDYRVVYNERTINHQFTQPFAGHCRSISNEADYSGRFFTEARRNNPNVQAWLYLQWPAKDNDDCWANGSALDGVPAATSWEQGVCNHLTYMEQVRDLMDQQQPGNSVKIVPAGLALAKLKIEVDAGNVPGMSNLFTEAFSDDLHLNEKGAYIISLAHYVAIYGESPVNRVTYKPASLTEQQAAIMRQIAWDVVSDYPESGLGGNGTLRNEICNCDCSSPDPNPDVPADGYAVREFWNNVGGTTIADIPVNTTPDGTEDITSLEGSSGIGDNYATRVKGYITSPADGWYTFYVAGDDQVQLSFSSDPNPANATKIAEVPGWTNIGEWNKYPEQSSNEVYLVKGGKFYFELLHKEGGGGDHWAVGWTGPGISSITPVAGTYLSPYDPQSGDLPADWNSQDVGSVAAAGSAGYSNGTFTIEGSGADIWNTADGFRYAYKSLSGDGEIVARVETQENTNEWAKAGVMIRESLTAGSKHAMTVVTPINGASFQRRTATDATSEGTTVGGLAAPHWVKIVRSGDSFTSFQSADGSSWTQIGAVVSIAMGADVYAGLAVTSHSDGVLSTATFSNVSVSGSGPSNDGFVVREYWGGITGTSVADIPVSTSPTSTTQLTSLEAPTDVADDYGARIRGYIIPATSGSYTFYIASDDNSQLHLSTNDQPANTSQIASVTGWTAPKEWSKYASQQSSARSLTAGTRYYFEILHKEGNGGDNLAVGWTGPGISAITVVGGAYLSSFDGGDPGPTTYTLTVNSGSGDGSYEQGQVVNLNANTPPSGQVFDVWTGDVANVADVNAASTSITMPASAVSVTATYKDEIVQDGFVVREYWGGVTGTSVADIPVNTSPSSTSQLTSLEAPTDVAENYGARIRGYIIPATSGSYTFYIASDDNSQLHLSTNDQPANTSQVASVTGWTTSREWTKYASQQSSAISLTAGTRYYFEVLHKEATGGDNVAVGWTGPGISAITVVGGAYLSSFDGGTDPTTYTLTVNSGSGDGSYEQGQVVNVSADAAPSGQVFDQWTGDVSNVADVFSSSTTVTMPAAAVSITATYKDQTSSGTTLSMDKNTTHQVIDGFGFFGARDVWWGSSDPAHFYSEEWLDMIVADLGVSLWRNELYPHNPPSQNTTSNQDAHWDKQRPMVQALKAKADQYGVDMKFILTVWSPPGEFKWWADMAWAGDENALRGPSGDGDYWSEKNGGTLNPNKYNEFATWLNQSIQMYNDAGVSVYAISPQNEPAFAQSFNSCTYTTYWYADMINAVIPQVKAQHPGVKVFGSENMLEQEAADHNYPYFYHTQLKNDPTAMDHMDILAVHGYLDGVSASSGSELAGFWTNHKVQFTEPENKTAWMTETSSYVDAWEGTTDKPGALSLAIDIQTALYFGDLSGWVFWQGSGLGGINEYNLMSDMTIGKKYYASKNFYRFIRPGAVRLTTSSPDPDVSLTAYEHVANGTHTIVLINTATSAKDISLAMTGSGLPSGFEMFVTSASNDCESFGNVSASGTITLPARSVVTLQSGGTPLSGSSARVSSKAALSELEGLKVYPTPTSDVVHVRYENSEGMKAAISTLLGQQIDVKPQLEEGGLSFDISSLSAGLYLLKVEVEGTVKTYKILKK